MNSEVIETYENIKQPKKEKLWTFNFFLLWQGQLVSALGDVVYAVALGFWILEVTGSTALMGTLMAVSSLPRIIISPFAGGVVDRVNRRNILVLMDFIRGIFIVLVAIAAFTGLIEIWMVFVAGIIISTCGAFFNPAVSSSIPDITPKSKLIKANSSLQMVYSGSNVAGYVSGGLLYSILGAPFLFLFNGVSYLFSSFSEIFIKIPKIEKPKQENTYFKDLVEGYIFLWKFKALRLLTFASAIINFFATMGIMLLLPMFEQNVNLGEEKYGFLMACFTLGMFTGMLGTSVFNIPVKKRFIFFISSCFMMMLTMSVLPHMNYFIMLGVIFLSGLSNAVTNVLVNSTLQLTVPQDKRGKVFALLATISMGLAPFAFAIGGVLAEFIQIEILISVCFGILFVFLIPLAFSNRTKKYINYDQENESLDELMGM